MILDVFNTNYELHTKCSPYNIFLKIHFFKNLVGMVKNDIEEYFQILASLQIAWGYVFSGLFYENGHELSFNP